MRILILLGVALVPLGLAAAWKDGAPSSIRPRLELNVGDKDRMVDLGETVVFTAKVENRSASRLRATLEWSFKTIVDLPSPPKISKIELGPRGSKSFELELPFMRPGFALVSCRVVVDGTGQEVKKSIRVGAEAEKVEIRTTAQRDFKRFWKRTITDLSKVEPEFKVEPKENAPDAPCQLFEVSMRSLGNVLVRGWLEVPRGGRGPYPALLRVPGYSQNMQPLGISGESIIFSFNIRGHGNSTDDVPDQPRDFWLRGLDDEQGYFYQGAYMDCIRALDYLCSRADVDQGKLGIWGGSQGGGLSFATAALDQRLDYCVADIPWLGSWEAYFSLTEEGPSEIDDWLDAKESRTFERALKTLSYFDTTNLAERIHCPTYMGIGLQDSICPPSTSFGTFNRVRGPKKFRISPLAGHGLGQDHVDWVLAELRAL